LANRAVGRLLILPAPTVGELAFTGALALDAATGKTVWAFKTPTPIRPMPVIAGGTVYLGADNGILYAIDLASGIQRWTAETGAPISAAPAVLGGVVYVPSAGSVLGAYDAASGAALWTVPVAVTELGGISTVSTDSGDILVLVGDDTGVLHGFDSGGTEVWTVKVTDASLTRWAPDRSGWISTHPVRTALYGLGAQAIRRHTPAPTPIARRHRDPVTATCRRSKGGENTAAGSDANAEPGAGAHGPSTTRRRHGRPATTRARTRVRKCAGHDSLGVGYILRSSGGTPRRRRGSP